MLKAVIFDFDGTIADTEGFQKNKWDIALKQFGIKISDEEYKRNYCGKSSTTTIPELLKKKYPEITYSIEELADKASFELQKQFQENTIELMPGSFEVLTFFKDNNIKYAVCSAKDQQELLIKLINSNTTDLFPTKYRTTQADANGKGKPEPDMYLNALKQLGVSKEEVLVFEDTEAGVNGAKSAGLKVIALPTQYTKYHDFSNANIVMQNGWPDFLKNWEKILKSIGRSFQGDNNEE